MLNRNLRLTLLLLTLFILSVLLAACSPVGAAPTATAMPVASPTSIQRPIPSPTSMGWETWPTNTASTAITVAVVDLARQLSVTQDQIHVGQVERVMWSDSCLGVRRAGETCAMRTTPGYRVILEAAGQRYQYHTDLKGEALVLAIQSLPAITDKVLVWEQDTGNACNRAEIGAQSIAYGQCGDGLTEGGLEAERAAELAYLLATYQSFTAATGSGIISFNGQGQRDAVPAEQRSIAEWARLVNFEAQGGRSGAAWGVAIAWRREGGIAGMCQELAISLSGWAEPSSCKPETTSFKTYRLSGDELARLYQWVDRYGSFEVVRQDPAVADAMKITLVFTGNGTQTPAAAGQDEIAQFAAKIYGTAVRQ